MSELVQPWPTTLMGLLGRSMHKRPQMQPAPCQCDKMRPRNIQNKIPAHPDSHFLSKVVSFIDDSLCLASHPVSHFAIHSQVSLDAMARRRLINLDRVVFKAETKSSGDRTGRQQPIDPLLKAKRMRFHFIALCKNHLILDPNSRPCLEWVQPAQLSILDILASPLSVVASYLCCFACCPYDWIAFIERNWIQTGFPATHLHQPTSFHHVFWVYYERTEITIAIEPAAGVWLQLASPAWSSSSINVMQHGNGTGFLGGEDGGKQIKSREGVGGGNNSSTLTVVQLHHIKSQCTLNSDRSLCCCSNMIRRPS